jgi:hypothetical protein
MRFFWRSVPVRFILIFTLPLPTARGLPMTPDPAEDRKPDAPGIPTSPPAGADGNETCFPGPPADDAEQYNPPGADEPPYFSVFGPPD